MGDLGRREMAPHLSVRHSDVVDTLGSTYYWNAPGLHLGNKVRWGLTQELHLTMTLL